MTLCFSFVGTVDFTTRILLAEKVWQSVCETLYSKYQITCSLCLFYGHSKYNAMNAEFLHPVGDIHTSQVLSFPFVWTQYYSISESS